MTDISTLPPLYSGASSQSTPTATPESDKAVLSSDFETFLKMLTAQVQNQDPLNPVDSTEYATQLATFSSVEQQVLTNDLLRDMSSALNGNALQSLSSWIGMEGLVRAPAMFEGKPVSIRPDYAEGADRAALVVKNRDGTEVQRYNIDVGQEQILWGGADETGATLPEGIYRFDVESYAGDSLLSTRVAQVYSEVQEVRNDGGTIKIRLADGTETTEEQVSGLRAVPT